MFSRLSSVLPNKVTRSLIASYFWLRGIGSRGMHSAQSSVTLPGMVIKIIPALHDNYMYLIIDDKTKEAAAVDPVESETMYQAAKQAGVNITTILTTHHHWDHAGGNLALSERLSKDNGAPDGVKVYGGDERVDNVTDILRDGTDLTVGSVHVQPISTPCHTTGHICYHVFTPQTDTHALFTGDTLFVAGCGKFFEGTADQMYKALIEKLSSLPDSTKVFCGHEYTYTNLLFAQKIEPENEDIARKLAWTKQMRSESQPTVPSTIGEEKLYNPFMRVGESSVQSIAKTTDPVATMAFLRARKDTFKP